MTEDTAESEPDAASGSGPSAADDDPRPRVEAALREVRRECWKAAVLHAVVEAMVVFFAANLVFVTVEPDSLPARFVLPAAVGDPLAGVLGVSGPVGLPGSGTLALVLGLVVFAVGVGIRVRRPLVEQFEAANPEVREALRTARDAVESEGRPEGGPRSERQGREPADSPMARRLYADVLDGLGRSSGLALVDRRRLGVGVAAVVLLSVVTVQVAILDLGLFDADDDLTDDGGQEPANNYTGLLDGDQVLGDSEAVESGEEELNASVESSGGGQDVGDEQQFPSGGAPGGGASGDGVEGQQAGFAAPEQVEDAELVREYNRRIRSEDGAGGDDGGDSEQDADGDNS